MSATTHDISERIEAGYDLGSLVLTAKNSHIGPKTIVFDADETLELCLYLNSILTPRMTTAKVAMTPGRFADRAIQELTLTFDWGGAILLHRLFTECWLDGMQTAIDTAEEHDCGNTPPELCPCLTRGLNLVSNYIDRMKSMEIAP